MDPHSRENHRFFTAQDLRQIRALGLRPSDVKKQLETYRRGFRSLTLVRPCVPGDGIRSLSPAERKRLIRLYDAEACGSRIAKFVPASGAASRMFAVWYAAAERGTFGHEGLDRSFFHDLGKMPFISLLKQNDGMRRMLKKKDVRAVLQSILLPSGLDFGGLPKALIPFHAYRNGEIRTALEEHLQEAAGLIADQKGVCRLHFTVSAEHVEPVKIYLRSCIPRLEKRLGVRFRVDLSLQSRSTSIVAADGRHRPFRDEDGRLVFRPGGHGALLHNLQMLDADLIFVKNIDNIPPESLQEKILPHKKVLGGLMIETRRKVYSCLRRLGKKSLSLTDLKAVADFCRDVLCTDIPRGYPRLKEEEKRQWLFRVLNRPLRVCGMVKNEGEPGGGPFWVLEKDDAQSLQIVESGHVDFQLPEQADIWAAASYFNPVDMVCCTKDYRGKKFILDNYVNRDAYLISPKTEKGRKLLALELPGLWNGGMARWNTIFVELPLAAFNPVKTVYDLLRPQHRTGRAVKPSSLQTPPEKRPGR
ncbi:MAG TPA: DUF4301 family protein [Smithellaceae bacterium]|nr:DUF4301 family protein [Smithellaceae bacterium]HRS82399.1 DUF4301 family protein [Smithellaceae bacterium]HRV44988.1 DUF4301 family protein [Smithellaceae bacterium]